MQGLNKVMLIGHLGKDPEPLTLESGTKLAKFSPATWEDWKNQAEYAHQNLKKGSREYLFEGQKEGTPVTARTAQVVFNRVYNRLGLPKGISFHALRHSYATHLVENGIDVTFVQELLGHNDVRTTLRYMHVSQRKINQIESPLDRAMRKNQEPKNEEKKSQ